MYNVSVTDSPVITVATRKQAVHYSVDGSLMNPLEAFYATLAGCAAVYAKKACAQLGISADGINIVCRPGAGAGGPLDLAKFDTAIQFPARITLEQRAAIMDSVKHCAVKQVVQAGAKVAFTVTDVS